MIRKLLATTALATLVSTGVYAQDTTAPAQPAAPATQEAPAAPVVQAEGHLASNLIGEAVYNGTSDDAEKIGDVNDLVIAGSGEVESIIVGVGGFLGIGEKDVAVSFDELEWSDRDGDRWIVVATTKEQLEAQPAFDRTPYEPADANVAATGTDMPADQTTTTQAPAVVPETDATDTAQAPAPVESDQTATDTAQAPAPAESDQAATDTAQAPADADQSSTEVVQVPVTPTAPADQGAVETDTTTTAAIDRSSLTEVPDDQIRAEELVGTTVYGANDENIGEIGDIILTQDGQIDAYIVDVGGFLGIGEKEVAIGSDNLSFMADQNGNKYLYTNFTQEQLEATPDYDESSWAEKRDEQRLTVTQ